MLLIQILMASTFQDEHTIQNYLTETKHPVKYASLDRQWLPDATSGNFSSGQIQFQTLQFVNSSTLTNPASFVIAIPVNIVSNRWCDTCCCGAMCVLQERWSK